MILILNALKTASFESFDQMGLKYVSCAACRGDTVLASSVATELH